MIWEENPLFLETPINRLLNSIIQIISKYPAMAGKCLFPSMYMAIHTAKCMWRSSRRVEAFLQNEESPGSHSHPHQPRGYYKESPKVSQMLHWRQELPSKSRFSWTTSRQPQKYKKRKTLKSWT